MSTRSNAIRCVVIAGMALAAAAPAASRKSQPVYSAYRYHALIPLGAESFEVRGAWHGSMTLFASAENPQFAGLQRTAVGKRMALLDEEGEPVKFYPENIDFRVTASTRDRLVDVDPYLLEPKMDANDYLLHLKFRVKVYHGLKETVLNAPSDLIGVPADIHYDERVFRVRATLPKISTQDRVVLEVLAPDGARLCKFHLDLF